MPVHLPICMYHCDLHWCIFITFDIGDFYENQVRSSRFT